MVFLDLADVRGNVVHHPVEGEVVRREQFVIGQLGQLTLQALCCVLPTSLHDPLVHGLQAVLLHDPLSLAGVLQELDDLGDVDGEVFTASRLPGTLLVLDQRHDRLPGGLRHTRLQHPVHLVLDLLDVVPRQDQLLADGHTVNEFSTQQALQVEFRTHVDGLRVHVPFVCGGQDVLQLDMDAALPVHGGVHGHSACVVGGLLDVGSAN